MWAASLMGGELEGISGVNSLAGEGAAAHKT
jgi:hypothetical protein